METPWKPPPKELPPAEVEGLCHDGPFEVDPPKEWDGSFDVTPPSE